MAAPGLVRRSAEPGLLSELPSGVSTPASTSSLPADALTPAILKKLRKEQKKLEKAANRAAGPAPAPEMQSVMRFKPRQWKNVQGQERGTREISIFTWNLLAQCLVRRELFPNSDFLKVKERVPTLMHEVTHYNSDIVVLQEVDRLSDHLPVLSRTHTSTYYIGYAQKSHGLLIAHKTSMFDKVGELTLRFDEMPLDESAPHNPSFRPKEGNEEKSDKEDYTIHDAAYDPTTEESVAARKAAGVSRSTRNVGLIVALKFKSRPGGVIVGTTHLFWHPQHVYERARQTGLLVRAMNRFRAEGVWNSWPAFLAGDFNTQPMELTYRLLMGLPPTAAQEADLARSTVVHESQDRLHDPHFVPVPVDVQTDVDGIKSQNLEQHPDRVIKNAREALESDGLVGLDGIKALFASVKYGRVRSAYGEAWGKCEGAEGHWYADRPPEVQQGGGGGWKIPETKEDIEARRQGTWDERVRRGDFEPIYTNYTPLWRCTLDYIFLLPPPASAAHTPQPRFTALLETHELEAMGDGLPLMGVEPSDHIGLAAIIDLPEID